MPRSMTGFGRCLVEDDGFVQQWEIKSVNSRRLDLKWRMPAFTRSLESRLERVVRRYARRGSVDVSLTLQYAGAARLGPTLDAPRASAMLDALRRLADLREERFVPDYGALLGLSALWTDEGEEADEDLALRLEEGLALALEDWDEARGAEGRALAADMASRILRMEEWTGIIEKRAPDVKEERIRVVRDRLTEILAQQESELDEGCFLQEVVILADKVDVSEELIRLRTHLIRLRELLEAGGDAGRRLDFTLQECFREINTCGNKMPDMQLSRLVVDFKNELEKCREQVQNLE